MEIIDNGIAESPCMEEKATVSDEPEDELEKLCSGYFELKQTIKAMEDSSKKIAAKIIEKFEDKNLGIVSFKILGGTIQLKTRTNWTYSEEVQKQN